MHALLEGALCSSCDSRWPALLEMRKQMLCPHWCRKNGISAGSIRPYTHGINSSDESKKVLEKLIVDAGRETVLAMYQHRLMQQAEEFKRC
jgi:hypothetical protein